MDFGNNVIAPSQTRVRTTTNDKLIMPRCPTADFDDMQERVEGDCTCACSMDCPLRLWWYCCTVRLLPRGPCHKTWATNTLLDAPMDPAAMVDVLKQHPMVTEVLMPREMTPAKFHKVMHILAARDSTHITSLSIPPWTFTGESLRILCDAVPDASVPPSSFYAEDSVEATICIVQRMTRHIGGCIRSPRHSPHEALFIRYHAAFRCLGMALAEREARDAV